MITPAERQGEQRQQLGNKTECALLGYVMRLGGDYAAIRDEIPKKNCLR